jgi:hypothetical protein
VPEQLDGRPINWPGEAAKFIEIIQAGHRYAVVWPSTNPDAAGAPYEWRAEGSWSQSGPPGVVPRPEYLAELPEAWVRGLALPYATAEKSHLATSDLAAWWDALRADAGTCPLIHSVCIKAVHDLTDVNGARHETARDALAAVVRAGGEGHKGAPDAVAMIGAAFRKAIGEARWASGEWQRLITGAVKLAAKANSVPRTICEHDIPPATGIVAPLGFTAPGAAAGNVGAPPSTAIVAPGSLTLPDEFWAARPALTRIRRVAHERATSGDVALYSVLTRLAAMTSHTVRADTGVGTPASLNLFAAIIAPTGVGKTQGLGVGASLRIGGVPPAEFPLGSGEGIAEAYMGEVMEETGDMAKDGSAKKARVRKQVRHNVLLHTDEGQGLNKLIERTGSTVGETLRSAWNGETIGQKNGRSETTRVVEKGSYALGLTIGYQDHTALPLLADVDAGTPQRFMWVWAVDPSIPDDPPDNPFPPGVPIDVVPTELQHAMADAGVTLTFPPAILAAIRRERVSRGQGRLIVDPFHSQRPLMLVKLSGLLARLDGRKEVNEEDCALAGTLWETSDAVRRHVQALGEARRGKAEAVDIDRHRRREAAAELGRLDVRGLAEDARTVRFAERVAVKLHGHGRMTARDFSRMLSAPQRDIRDDIVAAMVARGWCVTDAAGTFYEPGSSIPASAMSAVSAVGSADSV